MIAAAACTVLWAAISLKCAHTGHPILAAIALLIGVFPLWMAMPFQKATGTHRPEPEPLQAERPNNPVMASVLHLQEGDLVVLKVPASSKSDPVTLAAAANSLSKAYQHLRIRVAIVPESIDIGLVRAPEVDTTLEALRNLIQPEA